MHYVCTHNFQVSSQFQVCFMSKDIFIFMQHKTFKTEDKEKHFRNLFFLFEKFQCYWIFFSNHELKIKHTKSQKKRIGH